MASCGGEKNVARIVETKNEGFLSTKTKQVEKTNKQQRVLITKKEGRHFLCSTSLSHNHKVFSPPCLNLSSIILEKVLFFNNKTCSNIKILNNKNTPTESLSLSF